MQRIEAMGGMLQAIEQGYVQQEIQGSAYEYQRSIERHQSVVVGVNDYLMPQEGRIELMRLNQQATAAQLAKLSGLRQQRDQSRVSAGLDRLREAARGTGNLMPVIMEAVDCDTTLGEISDALREVFGEYQEKVRV
jgi:methylmalonyl-CoA mutase N-terminal domain/subunit